MRKKKLTDEIKIYILHNYGTERPQSIADRFNEKVGNIIRWAHELGCSREPNYWKAYEESIIRQHIRLGVKCSETACVLKRTAGAVYNRRREMRDNGRM